jgi:hypothetical protein
VREYAVDYQFPAARVLPARQAGSNGKLAKGIWTVLRVTAGVKFSCLK